VVGEFVVGAGEFELGHVAGDAAGVRHEAGLGAWLAAAVAGQAFGIVIDGPAAGFVVRIVAGQATDAGIVSVVALAFG
jgi:hypothetical protein